MAKKITFSKWHGLGNDFIIIDDRANKVKLTTKQIQKLGHRNFGIGFDQLMIVRKSRKADFKMVLYNNDGSRVEMCGNGIRCFAVYLHSKRITRKKHLAIETDAGIIRPVIKSGNLVEVDMGEPILEAEKVPMKNKQGWFVDQPVRVGESSMNITAVSMGNPHAVTFVKDVNNVQLELDGTLLENHDLFPNRTNVEFAQVKNRKRIEMRVWERGSGATLACGTGACATGVAAVLNNVADRKVTVNLPGGPLKINWDEKSNHVFMTGPAEKVFDGTVEV